MRTGHKFWILAMDILLIPLLILSLVFIKTGSITGAATKEVEQCKLEYTGKMCCYSSESSESEVKKLLGELYDKYPNNFPKFVGTKEETIGLVMALVSAETSPRFNANSISLGIAKAYGKECDEKNVGRGYGQFTFGTGAWTAAINGLSDSEAMELAGVSKQELTTPDSWKKYTIPGENPGNEENIKKLNLLAIAEYMKQIESQLVTSFPKLEQDADSLRIGTTLTYNSGAGCQISHYQQTGSWQIRSFTGQNIKCGETETHYNNVRKYLEKKDISYSLGSEDITKIMEESSGSYFVRPSFETKINYDFSDYKKIEAGVDILKAECVDKGSQDIEKCLKNNLQKADDTTGLIWDLGSCDTGEKALFYSFAKAYQECYFSIDNDCYCTADIPEDKSLNGDYKIILQDPGVYYATLGEFSQELEGHRKYINHLEEKSTPSEGQINIQMKFSNGKVSDQKYQGLFVPDKTKFTMYRSEGEVYMTAKVQESQKMPEKPECKTTNENFQFCVKSKKTYPKITDGKLTAEPVVYKFAVIFKDTVPPPKIADLEVKDMAGAERALNLTWSKSEAKDTIYYKIYWSDEQFDNSSKAKNATIFVSDDEMITYNLFVEKDDKEYYIAVAAVDKNGNELLDVDAKPGKSLDDLGPIKPTEISYNEAEKKLMLTIPFLNQDESQITEEEINIFIIKMPFPEPLPDVTECKEIKEIVEEKIAEESLIKGAPGEEKEISIELKKGCYAFTAKDDKGNVKLDENNPNLAELVELIKVI